MKTRSKHSQLPAALAALGLLLAGTFVVLAPHHARATFPGHNGRIAFDGHRDGRRGAIYVMNADGSHKRKLTQNPGGAPGGPDFSPAFSADGRKIAFVRYRLRHHHHNTDIYVMNADGSHQHRVTHGRGSDRAPAFSPSGKKIAFYRHSEIFVIRVDGTHRERLTHQPGQDISPTFSPDGKKIAFASDRDGKGFQIYAMNADGSHQRHLTHNARNNGGPAFSPSGRKIVFESGRLGHNQPFFDIYVMSAGGGHQRRLTHNSTLDFSPAFSPSGKTIVFARVALGTSGDGIYKMSAHGSRIRKIAGSRLEPSEPDWGVRS